MFVRASKVWSDVLGVDVSWLITGNESPGGFAEPGRQMASYQPSRPRTLEA